MPLVPLDYAWHGAQLPCSCRSRLSRSCLAVAWLLVLAIGACWLASEQKELNWIITRQPDASGWICVSRSAYLSPGKVELRRFYIGRRPTERDYESTPTVQAGEQLTVRCTVPGLIVYSDGVTWLCTTPISKVEFDLPGSFFLSIIVAALATWHWYKLRYSGASARYLGSSKMQF